ncbi:MAG: HVO_0758 family zinc finger protein [Halodesulfurarchaeum sp.]
MDSVRKGLRQGDIAKDTYDRLRCAECDTSLKREDDPEEVGAIRICPDCGTEWRQL